MFIVQNCIVDNSFSYIHTSPRPRLNVKETSGENKRERSTAQFQTMASFSTTPRSNGENHSKENISQFRFVQRTVFFAPLDWIANNKYHIAGFHIHSTPIHPNKISPIAETITSSNKTGSQCMVKIHSSHTSIHTKFPHSPKL